METITKPTETHRRRSRWQPAMVVAALLLTVVVGTTWISDGPRPTWLGADAVDAVTDFYTAFDRGDTDAVVASLADASETGILVRYVDVPGGSTTLKLTEEGGVRWLAYLAAAGSTYNDPECSAVSEAGGITTVECTSQFAHVTRRMVGAPTLAATTTFEVSRGAIVALSEEIVASGPNVGDAYHAWMSERYPEDAAIAIASWWPSVDAAVEAGQAEARHLDEYVDYLAENGCPITGC